MIALRIGGWAIFAGVLVSVGVDIRNALNMPEPHKLATWEHVALFLIAVFGLGLTSKEVSERLIRFIQALRGIKPKTDEHQQPKPKPRRKAS